MPRAAGGMGAGPDDGAPALVAVSRVGRSRVGRVAASAPRVDLRAPGLRPASQVASGPQAHRRRTDARLRSCDAPRGVSRSRRIARNRSCVAPAGERCCGATPAAVGALRLTSARCGSNVAPCPRPHRPADHRQGKRMPATTADRVCAGPSASRDAEHDAGRRGARGRHRRTLDRAPPASARRSPTTHSAARGVSPYAVPTAARRDFRGVRSSSCPHVRQGGAPSCRNAPSPSPITCSPG